jgi:hypothetical protein
MKFREERHDTNIENSECPQDQKITDQDMTGPEMPRARKRGSTEFMIGHRNKRSSSPRFKPNTTNDGRQSAFGQPHNDASNGTIGPQGIGLG